MNDYNKHTGKAGAFFDEKQPEEFIGTWKSDRNNEIEKWFIQNLANGTSVAIGLVYGQIFGYEADWWVEEGYYIEKITKILNMPSSRIGKVTKDQIEYFDLDKHTLIEGDGRNNCTYLRLSSDADLDKYQKIDRYLKRVWPSLPQDNGEGAIWLSVVRDKDTLIYIYQLLNQTKEGFNIAEEKKSVIESIKKDSNIVVHQMNFKIMYIFSDETMAALHIVPQDYS